MAQKNKVLKRSRFGAFLRRVFMIVIAYALFIALPIQYLPLPGFRAPGAPLSGGWQWGSIGACFDDLPVLQFVNDDGYLVVGGRRVRHFIKNITTRMNQGNLILKGVIDIPRKYSTSHFGRAGRKFDMEIKYHDLGKILRVKNMKLNGVAVSNDNAKYYSLTECGYPSLWNYLVRGVGIKKYWNES